MVYEYQATILIHPHAMGHVIGYGGTTIQRITQECEVVTINETFSEHQQHPVRMTIKGIRRDAVQQAIFRIDEQIAISNEWCKKNGIAY